jgi:hypothetical protein
VDLFAKEMSRQLTPAAAKRRLQVPAKTPVRSVRSTVPAAGPVRELWVPGDVNTTALG